MTKQSDIVPRSGLLRYIHYHVQALGMSVRQLCRTPVVSLLTMALSGFALALPLGLWFLFANLENVTRDWDSHTQISLFLKQGVTDAQADTLARTLRQQPTVASVTTISSAQGLADVQKQLGAENVLGPLNENPLPIVLEVHPAQTLRSPEAMREWVENLKQLPEVAHTQSDLQWVKQLYGIWVLGKQITKILASVLGVCVLFIIGNTLRTMVLHAQSEINVMKRLGGTASFIQRPFLYTGIFYGLGSTALASIFVYQTLDVLAAPLHSLDSFYGNHLYWIGLTSDVVAKVLAAGAVLGLVASWCAVRVGLRQRIN